MFNYEPQSDVKVPQQPLWFISVSLSKSRQALFHIDSTKRPLWLTDFYSHSLISPSLRFYWRHVPEAFLAFRFQISDCGSYNAIQRSQRNADWHWYGSCLMGPVTVKVIYNMTMKFIFNPVTIFSIFMQINYSFYSSVLSWLYRN